MALTIDEWLEQKKGAPTGASTAPVQNTTEPLDMGQGKRPRMTIDEWLASKDKTPSIAPATVEAAQEAPQPETESQPTKVTPQPAPEEPSLWDKATGALSTIGEHLGQQDPTGMGAYMEATPASAESQQEAEEFTRDELLPTVGGLLAGIVAPEVGMIAASAYVAGGSGLGEFAEQTMKKYGIIDSTPDDRPKTWGDVGKATITEGAIDGALNIATMGIGKAIPAASRKLFTLGSALKEDNAHMLKVLANKEGPILASDVAKSNAINYANATASNSFTIGGRAMEATRKEQIKVLTEAAQEPLEAIHKAAGIPEDALDVYQDSTLKVLPDELLADHLTTVIKDGERAALDVAGAMYDAIDTVAKESGTKEIAKTTWASTGQYSEEGKAIYAPKRKIDTVPRHTVNVRPAKAIIDNEIETLSQDLLPDAKAQFEDFARQQVRLMSFDNEITIGGAMRQMKQMRMEARQLAKSTDESAPTKRMFLLKSQDALMEQMDATAERMAKEGITMPDGTNIMDTWKAAGTHWREANETFGNKYVQRLVDKADATEGAAATLAGAMMKNRESAEAVIKAIDLAEASAAKTSNYGLADKISPTRAAVSSKVYENMLTKVLYGNSEAEVVNLLNTPDSRKALTGLLGEDNMELMELNLKALMEAKQKGLNISAFTQYARESSAMSDIPEAVSDPRKIMAIVKDVMLIPRMLSYSLHNKNIVRELQGLAAETNPQKHMVMLHSVVNDAAHHYLTEYLPHKMTEDERVKLEYRMQLIGM